jgi:hypothetical protein
VLCTDLIVSERIPQDVCEERCKIAAFTRALFCNPTIGRCETKMIYSTLREDEKQSVFHPEAQRQCDSLCAAGKL